MKANPLASDLATKGAKYEHFIAALLLFAFVAIAFAPFAFGDRTFLSSSADVPSLYPSGAQPNQDVRIRALKSLDPGAAGWQTEPEFVLEHNLVFNDHAGFYWNPYSGYGQPLAADMLSQPFSPFAWLVIARPTARSYNWFIILRFYASAIFAYLFLRYFSSFMAAIVGAILFSLTGYFLLYYNIAHLSVECLLPATLWSFESLIRRRSGPAFVAAALVTGAVIAGGMPESAVLLFIFSFLYVVARILEKPWARCRAWTILALVLGATIVGSGLVAFLVLPFLEFLPLSLNQHISASGKSYDGVVFDGFSLATAATYLAPLISGPPWSNIFSAFSGWSGVRGFFGIGTFSLAIIAVFQLARRRTANDSDCLPTAFFAIAAMFFLLKRFGSPIVNWIGLLPGLSAIYFPKYEEVELAFCLAVLATFGFEIVVSGRLRPITGWASITVPLSILTAVAAMQREPLRTAIHPHYFTYALGLALGVLLILGTLFFVINRSYIRPQLGAFALIFLVVGEGLCNFYLPMWYAVNDEPPITRVPMAGTPYLSFLQNRLNGSHNRVFGQDSLLFPEWAAAFSMSDVRDLNALYVARYLPFVRALLGAPDGVDRDDRFTGQVQTALGTALQLRFLTLSSVRFVLAQHDLAGQDSLLSKALVNNPSTVNAALHLGQYSIGSDTRDGVFMSPPRDRYAVSVNVPIGVSQLLFSIGMDPWVWNFAPAGCGMGVKFKIEVMDDRGHISEIARHNIEPRSRPADRHWFDLRAPIAKWSGKQVQLLFSTAASNGQTCGDWALWSRVRFDGAAKPEVLSRRNGPLSLVFHSASARVYEYRDPLPRLSFFQTFSIAPTDEAALKILTSPSFDPQERAVITSPPVDVTHTLSRAPVKRHGGLVRAGRLDIYSPTYVRGTVDAPQAGLVMLNDSFYPGWQARVDGTQAKIMIADYLFRGVALPAGHHVVEFYYESKSVYFGTAIAALSALSCACILIYSGGRLRLSAFRRSKGQR